AGGDGRVAAGLHVDVAAGLGHRRRVLVAHGGVATGVGGRGAEVDDVGDLDRVDLRRAGAGGLGVLVDGRLRQVADRLGVAGRDAGAAVGRVGDAADTRAVVVVRVEDVALRGVVAAVGVRRADVLDPVLLDAGGVLAVADDLHLLGDLGDEIGRAHA